MKCLLTSDTHYGFSQKTHRIHEKFLEHLAEVIKLNDVKLLIHSGDWSTNKQDQLERTLLMFRKYISIPIAAVRGNHCLWDHQKVAVRKMHWGEMQEKHREWFKAADIHHLENNGPMILNDHIIVGWDGWYHDVNPPTNDASQMVSNVEGAPTHLFHNQRAYKAFEKVIYTDTSMYKKAICVTHMQPWITEIAYQFHAANPAFFPLLTKKFDVLCTGHSHKYHNNMEGSCLVLNCGSDYDVPQFILFDTDDR